MLYTLQFSIIHLKSDETVMNWTLWFLVFIYKEYIYYKECIFIPCIPCTPYLYTVSSLLHSSRVAVSDDSIL